MYPQTVPYPIKVKTNQLVELKHIETFRLVYISVSYRYFRHFATFSTRIPLDGGVRQSEHFTNLAVLK